MLVLILTLKSLNCQNNKSPKRCPEWNLLTKNAGHASTLTVTRGYTLRKTACKVIQTLSWLVSMPAVTSVPPSSAILSNARMCAASPQWHAVTWKSQPKKTPPLQDWSYRLLHQHRIKSQFSQSLATRWAPGCQGCRDISCPIRPERGRVMLLRTMCGDSGKKASCSGRTVTERCLRPSSETQGQICAGQESRPSRNPTYYLL